VSFPSDPQPPVEPGRAGAPSTQEIPVVQPAAAPPLPPHPAATAQPPVPPTADTPVDPMETPHATGPVDFVPGLPGLGTPPPPPPAAGATAIGATAVDSPTRSWPDTLEPEHPAPGRPRKERAPRDRAAVAGMALAALSVVLLVLGLTLQFGAGSMWSTVPLWSSFATVAALVALVGMAAGALAAGRFPAGVPWRLAAGGLVGVAVFWLLVVLPDADSDRGFVLTAALAALGAALWVGPGRKA
jgi:hypothetical protein